MAASRIALSLPCTSATPQSYALLLFLLGFLACLGVYICRIVFGFLRVFRVLGFRLNTHHEEVLHDARVAHGLVIGRHLRYCQQHTGHLLLNLSEHLTPPSLDCMLIATPSYPLCNKHHPYHYKQVSHLRFVQLQLFLYFRLEKKSIDLLISMLFISF